jgi:Type I phosphodiesterase / nucleotide pyrophosphatase
VVRARIEWALPQRARQDVDVVAYDTTDDHIANYDQFFIEVNGAETALDRRGWFAVSKRLGDGLYGSWSKLLRRDPSLDHVIIYWGTISHTEAYPESFRSMLDDEVGFWPGPPDEERAKSWLDSGLDRGTGLDPDSFAEQIDRYADFFTQAAVLAIRRMPFDLLLAYQPTIDISEHQFRITSDAQKNATPENRAAGERVRRAAYADADRILGSIAAALDPSRDALVLTGDHGLASIDTEVRLGRLLGDWTLAPRWQVFAGGSIAHFYRFGGEDDAQKLMARLTELKSPDGAPVFERVERKAVQSHPNSGDVIAFAYPRFALAAGEGEPFVKPSYYGQHGGLNSHHEYDTTLMAWGRGVATMSLPTILQTQIARYVAQLLGIPAPAAAE